MSIEKSELKRAVAEEIGGGIEDVLEQARQANARQAGAAEAWSSAAQSVEGLLGTVGQQVDAGKMELPVASAVKEWLARAVRGLQGAAHKAREEFVRTAGRVEGLELSVSAVGKVRDREARHVEALAAGEVVEMEPRSRPVGAHPGMSIKERRLAEAAGHPREAPSAAPGAQEAPAPAPEPAPVRKGSKGQRKPRNKRP